MGKVKRGLENIGGILDIVNNAYGTVDKGLNTVEEIKSGSLGKNYNEVRLIEEKTQSMKRKFYILWIIMVIVTVLIWMFL